MSELIFTDQPRINARSVLLGLCTAQLLCWSIASILLYQTAPLDVVEAISWGTQWQFGYDRDPYLVAWLAKVVSLLAGNSVWPVFVLSQICVVATFAAVWRFAQYLKLEDGHALLAVTFLLGCYYYHFTTPEFNDNVLQLPLWAWAQYYSFRAIKEQTLSTWLSVGFFLGLALMAKYAAVVLVLSIVLAVLFSKSGRRSFNSLGIYLAVILCAFIVAPNIQWQLEHHWQYVTYAMQRASVIPSFWNHFVYPFKFLASQVFALLPSLLIYLIATKKKWQIQPVSGLLWWLALSPVFIVFLSSAINGGQIRSMWATPFFSLIGLLFVTLTRPQLSDQQLRNTILSYVIYWCLSLVALVATIILPPYLFGYSKNALFPSKQFSRFIEHVWAQRYPSPLTYIAGDRHYTARVAVYSKSHPVVYFEISQQMSPWVDEHLLRDKGGVFVWDVKKHGKETPREFKRRFPKLTESTVQEFKWHTGAKIPPTLVGIALLPPAKKDGDGGE